MKERYMMIPFTEGTRIAVDDCTLEGIHTTEIEVRNGKAWVLCPCCKGEGEHLHGRGPYTDSYRCDSCKGEGHFKVDI